MSQGELIRLVKPRALPSDVMTVEATDVERAALTQRFGVTAITRLVAKVSFDTEDDAILAEGTLTAGIEQPCAVTQENFTYEIQEPLALRFIPAGTALEYAPDEEIELDSADIDEIEYEDDSFDLGEALAQTLALAIDPYREGPDADAARKKAGIVSDEEVEPRGPLAEALKGLKSS